MELGRLVFGKRENDLISPSFEDIKQRSIQILDLYENEYLGTVRQHERKTIWKILSPNKIANFRKVLRSISKLSIWSSAVTTCKNTKIKTYPNLHERLYDIHHLGKNSEVIEKGGELYNWCMKEHQSVSQITQLFQIKYFFIVPKELSLFNKLQVLSIRNRSGHYPDGCPIIDQSSLLEIGNLRLLQKIELQSHNIIPKLPENFKDMKDLKSLYLDVHLIHFPAFMGQFTSLTHLTIVSDNLNALPKKNCGFGALIELKLSSSFYNRDCVAKFNFT